MKRFRPTGLPSAPLIRNRPIQGFRSPETWGVENSFCLICPDEPCRQFGDDEVGNGNVQDVCPVDAIGSPQNMEGPSISSTCIECGLCVMRCPVGALSISSRGVKVARPQPDAAVPSSSNDAFIQARNRQVARTDWTEKDRHSAAERIRKSLEDEKQDVFYGLVARLFVASGFPAWLPPRGDTSNRIDLILIDDLDSTPVEIKSRVESPSVNVKSVQQALENKVIIDERGFAPTLRDSSSLVVGFDYPPVRSDVTELISDVRVAFGVSIGIVSVLDLSRLAVNALLDGNSEPRDVLSNLKGRFS